MHICYQKESCSVRSIFFNNTVAVDLLDDRMGMFYIKGGNRVLCFFRDYKVSKVPLVNYVWFGYSKKGVTLEVFFLFTDETDET